MKITRIKRALLLGATGVAAAVTLSSPVFAGTTVNGFVNMEYNKFNIGHTSTNGDQNAPYGGFDLQRVMLGVQHEADIFTAIVQIQVEHGLQVADAGDGKGANASDPNGFGEFSMERAWIQARINKALKLKFGKEQTPTLWERAHYPSLYLSITQPQMDQNVFEEYMMGLMANGDLPGGFVYDAWLTKAENTLAAGSGSGTGAEHQQAVDSKTLPPTTGGRFGWQQDTEGYSVYLGAIAAEYHDAVTVADGLGARNHSVMGYETALRWKDVSVWSEYNKGLKTKGWYVLPSYTFHLTDESELSPYVLYDVFNDSSVGAQARKVTTAGLNYKPKAYLTVKGEVAWTAANNTELASQALRLGVIYYFN